MQNKGLIEMLIATFLWGSTPLMSINSQLPSGVFVFFRVLFAFPFIFYYTLKRVSFSEFFKIKPFYPVFLSGVMLGVNWIFFFWALNLTNVANVVAIYYTGPILSLILGVVFLKEKINRYIIFAVILAFVGVIISIGGFNIDKGIFISILAGLSYALLGFFSKLSTNNHHSSIITSWQILISIFLTAPFLFINEWSISTQTFIIVLISGIFHTAIALFLWYDALNYIKLSLSSILQYLDIVFSIILAWIFLAQTPTFNQIIGSVLIIIAGIVSVKKNKNEKNKF